MDAIVLSTGVMLLFVDAMLLFVGEEDAVNKATEAAACLAAAAPVVDDQVSLPQRRRVPLAAAALVDRERERERES
eukprot:3826877-Rhodomonas_salina.1